MGEGLIPLELRKEPLIESLPLRQTSPNRSPPLLLILQFHHPNVAEADLVAVVLKTERTFGHESFASSYRGMAQRLAFVESDAIEVNRHPRELDLLTLGVEPGSAKGDVVGLPGERRPGSAGSSGGRGQHRSSFFRIVPGASIYGSFTTRD